MSSKEAHPLVAKEAVPSEEPRESELNVAKVIAEAERLLQVSQEIYQQQRPLSPPELEEQLTQREKLLETQAKVLEKLVQMPEITKRVQARALKRYQGEESVALWEGVTEESYDQLANQNLITEEEARALNCLSDVISQLEERTKEWGGEEAVPFQLRERLETGRETYNQYVEQLEIPQKLARIRAAIRADQEALATKVNQRYSAAAEALGKTLERYQNEITAIETHPQVQKRLAEIEEERKKLKAIEEVEQKLMDEAKRAAESVRAKNQGALERLVQAAKQPNLIQNLREAYQGKGKFVCSQEEKWPGKTARGLFDQVIQAAYQNKVYPSQLAPWQWRFAVRSYADDKVCFNEREVRAIVEKWQDLPESDPRQLEAQRLATRRDENNLDYRILSYLAERLSKHTRQQEGKARQEAVRRAAEEQREIDEEIAKIAVVESDTKGGFVVEVPVWGKDKDDNPVVKGTRRAALGLEAYTSRQGEKYWQVAALAGEIGPLRRRDLLSLDLSKGVHGGGNLYKVFPWVGDSARKSGALIVHGKEFVEFYPQTTS